MLLTIISVGLSGPSLTQEGHRLSLRPSCIAMRDRPTMSDVSHHPNGRTDGGRDEVSQGTNRPKNAECYYVHLGTREGTSLRSGRAHHSSLDRRLHDGM